MRRWLHVLPVAVVIGCASGSHREVAVSHSLVVPPATSDSSFAASPDVLYQGALAHMQPELPTYDPERGAALLRRFIEVFPTDRRRPDAQRQFALLNEILALRLELRQLKEIDFRAAKP